MKNVILLLIFFAIAGIVFSNDEEYIGEIPIVEIGTNCLNEDPLFVWNTETRTAWILKALLVVPEEFEGSPDSWDQSEAFLNGVSALLGDGENETNEFVEASAVVAQSMIEGQLKSFAMLSRTNTKRTRHIECVNQVWQVTVDSQESEADTSDWLAIGEGDLDIETVESIERLITEINFQPGSDARPRHSFQEF